jgi:hypothetical protein
MAWAKKGSLVGPRGIGVVDLLANKLWSGSAAAGAALTVNYVHTKTMLAVTLEGFDSPLVGWQFGSTAYLHGVCLRGGSFYHLYAVLSIASNRATVVSTVAAKVNTGSGHDYGVAGVGESSPVVTAIYGI